MMRPFGILTLLTIGILAFGFSSIPAYAEINANTAFVLEGSGFAVTEESIKNTEINFVLITGSIVNGKGSMSIESGFVTLNDADFITDNLIGTVLRGGQYLRISGTADNPFGDEISFRGIGRLIQNSEQGSIYSFTGRIVEDNISHKILYTTKLSEFQSTNIVSSSLETPSELVVRILPNSSSQGYTSYAEAYARPSLTSGYFSEDRLAVEPGTTVILVNDDSVSHKIVSGIGLGRNSSVSQSSNVNICDEIDPEAFRGQNYVTDCDFTLDGRINTGEILPGDSVRITFEDASFYRLIDPDYPWMNITAYSFPNVGSVILSEDADSPSGEGFN